LTLLDVLNSMASSAAVTPDEKPFIDSFEAVFTKGLAEMTAVLPEPTTPSLSSFIFGMAAADMLAASGDLIAAGKYAKAADAVEGALVLLIGARHSLLAMAGQ
jgi:hypothetical protein